MLSKMRQTHKRKIFVFFSYNLYFQELFGKKKVNFLGLLSSVKNVDLHSELESMIYQMVMYCVACV